MEINIKIRSEILEYSINTEDAVNSLLLAYLGILDKNQPQPSKNKLNISFKSKIDLLFDINALTKEEHSDLELLMNFRNKFLHDIKCNSFLSVLNQFDNGIKNKFKKHLDKGRDIDDEESCRRACFNLFMKNLGIIKDKFRVKRISLEKKRDFITTLLSKNIRMFDLAFDLIHDLLKISESAILENPKTVVLANKIIDKCVSYSKVFGTDKKMVKLDKKFKELFTDDKNESFFK